jgi:drug/metabolite transporter (DMT)-like permease
MSAAPEKRLKAASLLMSAVGVASAQDAIVKGLTGQLPAYEIVMIRGLIGVPVTVLWLALTDGIQALRTAYFWPLMLRGAVLCSAYFAFILAIAAMPIANGVAIYFTMPFFVAALAGPFLGEVVPIHRWLSMIAAFIGVLIMVQPGRDAFEPASILAFYSAFGYAAGQMMGRHYSQKVNPLTISVLQTMAYFVVSGLMFLLFQLSGLHLTGHKSLEFLSRAAVWPSNNERFLLVIMGVIGAIGSVLFTFAYKYAAASFVAPFEYTAMIWAVLFGLVLFGDFPDGKTWLGMTVVIAAGLLMMWRDARQSTG